CTRARARPHKIAESSAAFERAAVARLEVQLRRARRVRVDAPAVPVLRREPGAAIGDAVRARPLEHGGGAPDVPEHVVAAKQPEPEVVAAVRVARLARQEKAPGFPGAGVAPGDGESEREREGDVQGAERGRSG